MHKIKMTKYNQGRDYLAEHYPLTLKPLAYPYDALEPHISSEIMYWHHSCNNQKYVDNLNASLAAYPQFQDWSLKAMLVYAEGFPEKIKKSIINNGGGVYNHELFFGSMSEKRNTAPSGNLMNAINSEFGSFDNFKKKFKESALSIFGSGYTWLTSNAVCSLQIINTANQDTPPLAILNPLLLIDVWEHAYNCQHICYRDKYIDAWFNVVDWDIVSSRFTCALI